MAVKGYAFAVLGILSVLCTPIVVHAEADTYQDPGLPAKTGKHGKHLSASPTPQPVQDKVSGQCSIVPGPGNPISGPCANMVLILNDSTGKLVFKTRTTNDGNFEFDPAGPGPFRIVTGSGYYEVVWPSGLIPGNETAELTIRVKPPNQGVTP